jgi:hypothetical protein
MSEQTAAPPPHIQLIQMGTSLWVSRMVHAAAKLSLADHIADSTRSAEELAGATLTHAPSLYRFLRALAMLGLLTEDAEHRFALTPLGNALRADAPGAARAAILTLAGDWSLRGWENLHYSLETGKSGYEKAHGMPLFDCLAHDPEMAALFTQTMLGFHGHESKTVAAAYDFSGFETIVDVGGASGNLISAVLEAFAQPRGILFDLPHVVRDSGAMIQARGLADRITVEGGSFFDAVPTGGEAYMLSHIIHDWAEDLCLKILGNIRRAMKRTGRVLIVEMVLPPGDAPHPGKMLDMMMLVGPGGQERTAAEYDELLGKAGFRMTRVVPTTSDVSVVEAVQA